MSKETYIYQEKTSNRDFCTLRDDDALGCDKCVGRDFRSVKRDLHISKRALEKRPLQFDDALCCLRCDKCVRTALLKSKETNIYKKDA